MAFGWISCQPPGGPAARPEAPPVSIVMALEDFDLDQPSDSWSFRNPALWRIGVEGPRRFLQMAYPEGRAGGARTPTEYALYNPYEFRSFSLSVRARLDADSGGQERNLCLLFGWQDPGHYYYIKLSDQPGAEWNNIYRVAGGQVTPLVPSAELEAALTAGNWGKVDLLRDMEAGTITVYVNAYDGQAEPYLQAVDKRYEWGHIGCGAIHDHGSISRFGVEGQARRTSPPAGLSLYPAR